MKELRLSENKNLITRNGEVFTMVLKEDSNIVVDEYFDKLDILVNKDVNVNLVNLVKEKNKIKELNITLNDNSHLIHQVVNVDESPYANVHVNVNADAIYEFTYVDLASTSYKFDLNVDLLKEGAKAYYDSSIVAQNNVNKDVNVRIINHVGNTESIINNYGISGDKSLLTFLGVGQIEKGAKAAKAIQKNTMLVLDEKSRAIAKPQLLIAENDVVASHANSVGTINDEIMFYLCSRGLNKKQARQMMVNSYLDPVIAKITNEQLSTSIKDKLSKEGIMHV